jgi:hypothetical protein
LGISGTYIDPQPFQWFFSERHSKPYRLTNKFVFFRIRRLSMMFFLVAVTGSAPGSVFDLELLSANQQ